MYGVDVDVKFIFCVCVNDYRNCFYIVCDGFILWKEWFYEDDFSFRRFVVVIARCCLECVVNCFCCVCCYYYVFFVCYCFVFILFNIEFCCGVILN